MKRAYKYRIYPTEEQKKKFSVSFAANRWFWNYCLDEIEKEYSKSGKHISAQYKISKQLPKLKKEEKTQWLKEVHSTSFQNTAIHLDEAFIKFFKKQGGYPKYKTSRYSDSYTQNINLKQKSVIDWKKGILHLGRKYGDVKIILHRKFRGQVKSITISKKSYDYYESSILVDDMFVKNRLQPSTIEGTLGIDMGIKIDSNIITSNGDKFPVVDCRKEMKRLKKMQHQLSRKQWFKTDKKVFSKKYDKEIDIKKPSKNYIKLKDKIAKLQNRIRLKRNYNTNLISSKIAKNEKYNTIAIENLNVKGMVKNHNLSSRITNANMGELKRQLLYKGEWNGKNVIEIDRFYPSSQLCSNCGYRNIDLKNLAIREWTCPVCGTHHDRDINAAINIKKEGYRKLSEGQQK